MADAMRATWERVEDADGVKVDRFPSKESEAQAALAALRTAGWAVVWIGREDDAEETLAVLNSLVDWIGRDGDR